MSCSPSIDATNELSPSGSEKEEGLTLEGPLLIGLLQNLVPRGASLRLQAKGCSMAPFLRDGDVLTLSPIRTHPLSTGDIVAFTFPQSEKLAIHRICRTIGENYLIRGDYCPEPDGLIAKKYIVALVSRIERNGMKVPLGLGPEKILIAYLSAKDVLFPLLSFLYRCSSRFSS